MDQYFSIFRSILFPFFFFWTAITRMIFWISKKKNSRYCEYIYTSRNMRLIYSRINWISIKVYNFDFDLDNRVKNIEFYRAIVRSFGEQSDLVVNSGNEVTRIVEATRDPAHSIAIRENLSGTRGVDGDIFFGRSAWSIERETTWLAYSQRWVMFITTY